MPNNFNNILLSFSNSSSSFDCFKHLFKQSLGPPTTPETLPYSLGKTTTFVKICHFVSARAGVVSRSFRSRFEAVSKSFQNRKSAPLYGDLRTCTPPSSKLFSARAGRSCIVLSIVSARVGRSCMFLSKLSPNAGRSCIVLSIVSAKVGRSCMFLSIVSPSAYRNGMFSSLSSPNAIETACYLHFPYPIPIKLPICLLTNPKSMHNNRQSLLESSSTHIAPGRLGRSQLNKNNC